MTDAKQARPATLERRSPQPAPDEKVDPVDLPPAPAKKAPRQRKVVAKAEKSEVLYALKQRDIVVSLSTRVSLEVSQMLETEVARTGKSVRAAVEHALRLAYGQDGNHE